MANTNSWLAETCTTKGTGDLFLAGAIKGMASFQSGLREGLCWYTIEDSNGNRETGKGHFDGRSTLQRTQVDVTLYGGVYNYTDPEPLPLTGNSKVACTFDSKAYQDLLITLARIDSTYVHWEGTWTPREYNKNSLVLANGWLRIANQVTSERADPITIGEPEAIFNGQWTESVMTVTQAVFVQRLTFPDSFYFLNYSIETVAGNNYNIFTVTDPLGAAIPNPVIQFTATENGTTSFTVRPVIVGKDTVVDLCFIAKQPDPEPDTDTLSFNYATPNTTRVPSNGEIVHADKVPNVLRVSHLDNQGNDSKAVIDALVVGSQVQGVGKDWGIQSVTDMGTYSEVEVSPPEQGFPDGVSDFTFITPQATSLTYRHSDGYYSDNPNIKGFILEDASYDPHTPLTDNAVGFNCTLQRVTASDHWDTLAVTDAATNVEPQYSPMVWRGMWQPDVYDVGHTVRYGDWTATANQLTTPLDSPAPEPTSPEIPIFDGTWGSASAVGKQIICGQRITLLASSHIVANITIEVVSGQQYEIFSTIDPEGNPETRSIYSFISTVTGTQSLAFIPRIVRADTKMDIGYRVSTPLAVADTFTGFYGYDVYSGEFIPAQGRISRNMNVTENFWVHHIDLDGVNLSTDLTGLTVGDKIKGLNTEWTVQSNVLDNGFSKLTVSPPTLSNANTGATFTFELLSAASISYKNSANYYNANPNIQGFVLVDEMYIPGSVTLSDDAVGLNLTTQEISFNEKWDIVSLSGTGTGLGTVVPQ